MNSSIFVLYFASTISILLVIYAAFMMVRGSKGHFADAFRIIIGGHLPIAGLNIFLTLQGAGVQVPEIDAKTYEIFTNFAQVLSAISILAAIYIVKSELYDKIEKFMRRAKEM